MHKCLLCSKEDFTTLIKYEGAPSNIQGLLKEKDLSKDKKINFNLLKCNSCGLVQLDDFENIPVDYYDEYYMTTSFSDKMIKYEKWLADKFFNRFALKNKSFFEIGCGDGQLLKVFEDMGLDVIGVEPSKVFASLAEKRGIKILTEYFDDKTNLKDYDAFGCRQVFEHLKNPQDILRNVKRVLKEGGVGFIEVPSFERAIIDRRYYDIFSDHTAYYTKETLALLVESAGFEVVEVFNSFNEEYIVVFFRKNSMASLKDFINDRKRFVTEFKEQLSTLKNNKVYIWGAGGKGNALLNMIDGIEKVVEKIIDIDPKKQGKYTIGNHVKIYNPDILLTDAPDVIIISAMTYCDEIKVLLKEKYRFSGRIFTIAPFLKEVT